MSFGSDIERHRRNLARLRDEVPKRSVAHVERSMKYGSQVTGAPGQPVRSGALRDSYRTEELGPAEWRVLSDSPYAMDVEDNVHGVQFHNGGPHSAKMTIAEWPALVEHEVRGLGDGG